MNNSKLLIPFICFPLILASCENRSWHTQNEQTQLSTEQKNYLKQKALIGDAESYSKLVSYYSLQLDYDEPYLLSLVVANKYNSAEAYFTLYWSLLHSSAILDRPRVELLNNLDAKSRYYGLYYLLKSYELGYYESVYHCQEVFGEHSPYPKSDNYLDSIRLFQY